MKSVFLIFGLLLCLICEAQPGERVLIKYISFSYNASIPTDKFASEYPYGATGQSANIEAHYEIIKSFGIMGNVSFQNNPVNEEKILDKYNSSYYTSTGLVSQNWSFTKLHAGAELFLPLSTKISIGLFTAIGVALCSGNEISSTANFYSVPESDNYKYESFSSLDWLLGCNLKLNLFEHIGIVGNIEYTNLQKNVNVLYTSYNNPPTYLYKDGLPMSFNSLQVGGGVAYSF